MLVCQGPGIGSVTHKSTWALGARTKKGLLGNYKFPTKVLLYPWRKFYVCTFLLILFIDVFNIYYNPFQNHKLVNCFCCLTADVISTVEFSHSGDLLATGDKGGRVVIFQREQEVSNVQSTNQVGSSSTSHITCKEGSTVIFPVSNFI